MSAEGTYPNLDMASCFQLTFGADIRLSALQVGAIRDSILAMFPAASVPPWYFREVYRWDDVDYEIAASISASNRSDPQRPYSAFFRIQKPGEQAIEGPLVRELLYNLEPQEESAIYCTASFAPPAGDGSTQSLLPSELHRDDTGSLLLEAYSVGIYDDSSNRLGAAEIRRIGDTSIFYSISFLQNGKFGAPFASALMDRAVTLFKRVQLERGGETHAGQSA